MNQDSIGTYLTRHTQTDFSFYFLLGIVAVVDRDYGSQLVRHISSELLGMFTKKTTTLGMNGPQKDYAV